MKIQSTIVLLILAFMLWAAPTQADLGDLCPTLRAYVSVQPKYGPGIGNNFEVEIKQAFILPLNLKLISTALKDMDCVIANIIAGQAEEGYSVSYTGVIGLFLDRIDPLTGDFYSWKGEVGHLAQGAAGLYDFLRLENDPRYIRNIHYYEDYDIGLEITTDPNYDPFKTTYTVRAFIGKQEIDLGIGFKDIKKHNGPSCQFNHSPASRIRRSIDQILEFLYKMQ